MTTPSKLSPFGLSARNALAVCIFMAYQYSSDNGLKSLWGDYKYL